MYAGAERPRPRPAERLEARAARAVADRVTEGAIAVRGVPVLAPANGLTVTLGRPPPAPAVLLLAGTESDRRLVATVGGVIGGCDVAG
jgi:hypothetical protein